MAFEPINWSTTELQIYILLLAANADGEETQEECPRKGSNHE